MPNNATLSIGGDIDVAQTKAWIEKYFGSIPKGTRPIPRPTIVEPQQTEERRATYLDKVQLPAVVFAYHMPAQGTPDAYALEMVAKILSEGKSSRLQKELVDKQQKAVAAGAFNLPSEDPGLAMMYGIGNMGVAKEDIEKSMDAEVDKIIANGITPEELSKCKNQIENEFISQNQRVLGIVENLANYHVYFGDANLINKELDRYMKVTAAEMQAVAKKYFVKTNRLVLYYLPDSSKN